MECQLGSAALAEPGAEAPDAAASAQVTTIPLGPFWCHSNSGWPSTNSRKLPGCSNLYRREYIRPSDGEDQVLVFDLRRVERAAVSVQALLDDVRDALPHLILGQRRSLRPSLAHARPHVHWQSLVLRAQTKAPEKPFQQSLGRNRPVLRAQNDLGRICQEKLRNSLATSVLRGLILSSPFARRV